MKYPDVADFEITLADLCVREYMNNPDRVLLRYDFGEAEEIWTVARIIHRTVVYANLLNSLDVKSGDVVAVMLDNHPDHVAVMFALGLTGAIWLPLDRRFTSANVGRVLSQVDARVAIVEPAFSDTVINAGFHGEIISRQDPEDAVKNANSRPATQQYLQTLVSASARTSDDTRALLFTSGTTGLPKGVVVTERMLMASALFCGHASDANSDAVFYLWEPLNHIGGAQIVPMALLSGCSIAMTKKFSVSRFWSEVIESGANRIHYLGGVLDLLLRQEASPDDRKHGVVLGFGAGAGENTSRAFTNRFGVVLREVYGMTEASSFTTMNFDGPLNSIGKALPDFDLILMDDNENHVAAGQIGEIGLRAKRGALITPHYYENEKATNDAFRNGYFHTGDLATQDKYGYLYFVGRTKELIRCKGENISPWEIESVFKQHSAVLEVAVLGVESDISEQDIAAFVRLTPLSNDAKNSVRKEIRSLLKLELAAFQHPRYIVEIEEFPKTPSERIEKHKLDTAVEVLNNSW